MPDKIEYAVILVYSISHAIRIEGLLKKNGIDDKPRDSHRRFAEEKWHRRKDDTGAEASLKRLRIDGANSVRVEGHLRATSQRWKCGIHQHR